MPRGGPRLGAGRKKRVKPTNTDTGLISSAAHSTAAPAKKVIGRPFQPGQSGNPGGRPKSERRLLAKQHGEDGKALFKRLDALRNDPATNAKLKAEIDMFLIERLNGKAPQTIAHTGEDGGPVAVEVRFVDA